MNDRDRAPGGGHRDSARRSTRGGGAGRRDEPVLPDDVSASDLDSEVRRDLLTLDKANAEHVARHLVMVTRLLDENPGAALAHARAARGRAARVGLVRETLGIAAYNAGEWQEALSELRAARRITGSTSLLPLIADAERGLGRPDRAVEIARGDEARTLSGEDATEMRIVEAGARLDLGEPQKAVVTLHAEDLSPGRTGTAAARLFYAYASALEALGRRDEAVTWFMNAASADVDDVTDAELRLMEITGDTDSAQPFDHEARRAASSEATTTETPDLQSSAEPAKIPAAASARDEVAAAAASDDTSSERTSGQDALVGHYGAVLLDLDGTLFTGGSAIPGAVDALADLSFPALFVTNNASRRPAQVAEHLTELGFSAQPDQIVTSAQTGARLLAEHLEPGSRALVVGSDGLVGEVRAVGIGVTRSADDRPAAVIQGYSPDIGWAELSEAALAIRAGALWVATNVDATLPSERGLMVGNGSLVAAVAHATGAEPLVAGKPAAPLMADAIARAGADHPLVVGDRLDTDIQGAHAVGLDSLLVLTGVSTGADLLAAPPEQRPTFVADDLTGLFAETTELRIAQQDAWRIDIVGEQVTVSAGADCRGDADRRSLLPALAHAVWAHVDRERPADLSIAGGDADAAAILTALGLSAVSLPEQTGQPSAPTSGPTTTQVSR